MAHPLTVKPLGGSNQYEQCKFLQFQPNPGRYMLLGDTGSGKTSAAFIIFKELFHLCTRWHIISSTIEHDGSFEEMKDMIYEGLRQQGIDADEDPQEKFCHESLDALAGIVQQARRRTRLAKEADQKYLPQTFLYIDDMISFMRHSSMLDRLMATSRHIGLNIVLNSQQYVGLSTLQRKSLSCIGIFKVHARELEGVISELAGKNNASADDLYEAFRIATAKAHGFLWIRRQAKSQDEMLFSGFTKRIVSD